MNEEEPLVVVTRAVEARRSAYAELCRKVALDASLPYVDIHDGGEASGVIVARVPLLVDEHSTVAQVALALGVLSTYRPALANVAGEGVFADGSVVTQVLECVRLQDPTYLSPFYTPPSRDDSPLLLLAAAALLFVLVVE